MSYKETWSEDRGNPLKLLSKVVKPTIMDVNGKAVLDREPVERAYRVELESCKGVELMDSPN